MHPNVQLIGKFYTAFQARDADGMCACYHPDIVFTDPAFGTLQGARATAMWHMLCERGKDLHVTFSGIQADDAHGSAHWEARYPFSKKRRQVHNIIEAGFVFKDGLIIQHTDLFSFSRWAGMALGPLGTLLGWTPFLRSAVRKDALRGLEEFMNKQGHGGGRNGF